MGAWDGVVVKVLRYFSDGPEIDSRRCHWIFQWHISFRPYHDPGIDSAPSENEYQEHFLGVKAAGAWGWQPHHLLVPNVMKIWEAKPPGTLWATPGLLRDCFTFIYIYIHTHTHIHTHTPLHRLPHCGILPSNNTTMACACQLCTWVAGCMERRVLVLRWMTENLPRSALVYVLTCW